MLYATFRDVEAIVTWLNEDPEVAWIVKDGELDGVYQWRAQRTLDAVQEQLYALWHIPSGPLNIPSGSLAVPDASIPDPFVGWTQTLGSKNKTSPWFGGNLPGPFHFRFNEAGRESAGSLGRSGFTWDLDRYKSIGRPAHPEAKRWWARLKRFVGANATAVPWGAGRQVAFVFPDALRQERLGRARDVNMWVRN